MQLRRLPGQGQDDPLARPGAPRYPPGGSDRRLGPAPPRACRGRVGHLYPGAVAVVAHADLDASAGGVNLRALSTRLVRMQSSRDQRCWDGEPASRLVERAQSAQNRGGRMVTMSSRLLASSTAVLLALCSVSTAAGQPAPSTAAPVNPNASPEARALLQYLHSFSGQYTLAGQHNYANHVARWTDRAYGFTGRYPALFGQDFGFEAGQDKDSIEARPALVAELKRQYRNGALVTLTWHAVRPTDDEPVSFRQSVQGRLSDFEWRELLTQRTSLHDRWSAQVDVVAGYLRQLRDARVPVLWRPYHEMNGGWFWWGGRKGPDGSSALYRQLYGSRSAGPRRGGGAATPAGRSRPAELAARATYGRHARPLRRGRARRLERLRMERAAHPGDAPRRAVAQPDGRDGGGAAASAGCGCRGAVPAVSAAERQGALVVGSQGDSRLRRPLPTPLRAAGRASRAAQPRLGLERGRPWKGVRTGRGSTATSSRG